MQSFKNRIVPGKVPFWLDTKKRAILFQFITLGMVGLLAYYLISNTLVNLERQKIATGFGFLHKEASFEIGESLISYSAANTYGHALLVGALNTIKVAFVGIVLTIILGTIIGMARLSTNWLVAKLAGVYVEVMQDIPVLLQLFFWYAIFYEGLSSSPRGAQPGRRDLPFQPRGGLYGSGGTSRSSLHVDRLCDRMRDRLRDPALGKETAGGYRTVVPNFSCGCGGRSRPSFHHLAGLRSADEDERPPTHWI